MTDPVLFWEIKLPYTHQHQQIIFLESQISQHSQVNRHLCQVMRIPHRGLENFNYWGMFLLDFRTIVQILLHKHHQWPSRKYRYDSSLIAGHANLINCHPDIIDNLLTTHNIFHFRFFGELLQLVAVVLFSRLQLSKISKNVFLIFHFIFIKFYSRPMFFDSNYIWIIL